ncbi:hypothetical protein GYH30_006285 [Glycine max]|uniref:Large ribosomal subunit protein eL20 domain-containing protein n=1 Tax=Glycine max TaxID=3847 RepID=A0A0R0KFG3_SOYBN|nr:hypothetical protein GYH30_006285 [Glycine max]
MEILAQASYGEVINNIGEQSREKTCMGQQRGSHQVQATYNEMASRHSDTTLNGAVEAMYSEMASRHRVRSPCIQIIKTTTIPAKLCKKESTKQFHNSKI